MHATESTLDLIQSITIEYAIFPESVIVTIDSLPSTFLVTKPYFSKALIELERA